MRRYADRRAAGDRLATDLGRYASAEDVLVLGLPRGGVPVAAAVAAALCAPLDVLIVRKLGLPGQPELAMGAIAGGPALGDDIEVVRNEPVIARAHVSPEAFGTVRDREVAELRRRAAAYRGDRPPVLVAGRPVIVVDDGLATGSTMRAAVLALRARRPARIVVAVPIGSPRTCADLATIADEVVCPWQPDDFGAVSQGYRDFAQTPDDEVERLLR